MQNNAFRVLSIFTLLHSISSDRKNWLFYKTELGALIGDIVCSFLKTCEAANVNPFDYFVWVMKNNSDVKLCPENFLPWKFKAISVVG
jgi:hypothetical protein